MQRVAHISVRGKAVPVPSLDLDGVRVVARGRFPRIALIHDEEWLEVKSLPDPLTVLDSVRRSGLEADVFSFTQRIPDIRPRHEYFMELDNAAIIPVSSYKEWWDGLSQDARRNVRIPAKKGVIVKSVPFDDALINGIMSIYNEAPVRLGKPFWHYGKDFDTVRRENGTYLERSEFIGAFFEGRLIGFIKLVFVDRIGSIMQILSMIAHQDKRTTNALIAKAVEVCEARGMAYLMYCSYVYDKNESSLLTEFKRRNGFIRMEYPRYYVPLTWRGRLALGVRAHRGIKGMLPPAVLKFALQLRAKYYSLCDGRTMPVAR